MSVQICPQCTYVNEHEENLCSVCQYEFQIDLDKIKEKGIIENYDLANKLIPETFFHHSSLYITCKINNFEFQALIDTGAQSTIMGCDVVEKCELLDLIDVMYKGKILGVNQEAETMGRIHCVDILVEDDAIPMSFTVLKTTLGSEVIIGMDILSSHRSVIDIFNKTITFSEKLFQLKEKRKTENELKN